ncbi:hypothetical protein NWF32_06010 [Pseudomonas qingdaonensis]|nr:hypothetical protein [Pseudomonas qingdaonensis]
MGRNPDKTVCIVDVIRLHDQGFSASSRLDDTESNAVECEQCLQRHTEFLGNQFTGVMYCTGIIMGSITIKLYMVSGVLDSEFAYLSAIVFASGVLYFYVLQCAIQKTMSPALRTPAVPR